MSEVWRGHDPGIKSALGRVKEATRIGKPYVEQYMSECPQEFLEDPDWMGMRSSPIPLPLIDLNRCYRNRRTDCIGDKDAMRKMP